jgi:hypothetical protein
MDIDWTTKDAKMTHLWLHTNECLLWYLVLQDLMRTPVLNVDLCVTCLCPKKHGQVLVCIMALVAPMMDRYFCSATPFCCGLYGTVNSLLIPTSLQKPSNSLEVYSPPLSNLKTLIYFPVWFSTRALNS